MQPEDSRNAVGEDGCEEGRYNTKELVEEGAVVDASIKAAVKPGRKHRGSSELLLACTEAQNSHHIGNHKCDSPYSNHNRDPNDPAEFGAVLVVFALGVEAEFRK